MGLISLIARRADIIEILVYFLSMSAVLFITLPFHEWAHAFTATKLGDRTPKYQGRLTLNPLAHIDPIGAICIALVGFGWGKPVQVNARNFKSPKWGMALTAFAGPLSNIVLAFVALLLLCISTITFSYTGLFFVDGFRYYLNFFFLYIANISVGLAVFNLIPVPPLDGSKLLMAVLPDRIYYKVMQYERYLYFALVILIVSGALDAPMSFLVNKIMDFLFQIAFLPYNLFIK